MKRIFTILIITGAALAQTPSTSEALDALRALRTATDMGVSSRDYSPRVLDAKVKIDKYLTRAKASATRTKIEAAMQAHFIEARAWAAFNSNDRAASQAAGELTRNNAELAACPEVLRQIKMAQYQADHADAQFPLDRDYVLGLALGAQPKILFDCANAKLAEAEALRH